MSDFAIKQGGRLPGIRCRLRGPDVHLASAVEFHMKQVTTTSPAPTKSGAGVIEDTGTPNVLVVRYDWGATDTDTIGFWLGEWWATIAGKLMKLPNDESISIEVKDDAS